MTCSWGMGGGTGGMRFQLTGKVGKDSCPNCLQPLPGNFDRRGRNDGNRELVPVFQNPYWKCPPSPPAVAHILTYFVGVLPKGRSSEREKNKFGSTPVNIVNAVIKAARSHRCKKWRPMQLLQFRNASHLPCRQFLYSLQVVDICYEVWRTGWRTIFEV